MLIVSPDQRNALATDVIAIPLSTRRRPGPWHVAIRAGEAGVPAASVIKCEQITTVEKHRLLGPALGGPLSAQRMQEVELAVLRAIGVPAGY
jgi:mRNA interferase MazF